MDPPFSPLTSKPSWGFYFNIRSHVMLEVFLQECGSAARRILRGSYLELCPLAIG